MAGLRLILLSVGIAVVLKAAFHYYLSPLERNAYLIAQFGHFQEWTQASMTQEQRVLRTREKMELTFEAVNIRAKLDFPNLFDPESISVRDFYVPLYHEENQYIRARFYARPQEKKQTLLLWFHGGGWAHGSLETDDLICRKLFFQGNFSVLSVEYRLAPEHIFPTAFFDAYSSFLWAHANHEFLGIDPHRVIVAGESSGGNLAAAVVSHHLHSGNLSSFPIFGTLLIYPPLAPASMDTSFQLNGCLTYQRMESLRAMYAGNTTWPRMDFRFAPLTTPSEVLATYPAKTVVVIAQHDVLADENRVFVQRLKNQGVPASLLEYSKTIHGFFGRPFFGSQGEKALKAAVQLFA